MKVLTLFFTLLLFTFFSNAQMIVDDDGQVGVGDKYDSATSVTTSTGSSVYDLEVDGRAAFSVASSRGFKVQDLVNQATISGYSSYTSNLGEYYNRMYAVYTKYLYYEDQFMLSDLKVKENIRPLESSLNKIMQVNTIKFDYKPESYNIEDPDVLNELIQTSKDKYGVIAQEFKAIFPELVQYNEEADLNSVNYVGLIPILVNAIQEQQVLIDELKSKVDILELGK